MLAYDYPLLGVFWTILFIALWATVLFLLVWIVADIFRSPDLGGGAKALWLLAVIFVPLLGSVGYLVAREHLQSEREFREIQEQHRLAAGVGPPRRTGPTV
jgi:hypothetical protein